MTMATRGIGRSAGRWRQAGVAVFKACVLHTVSAM